MSQGHPGDTFNRRLIRDEDGIIHSPFPATQPPELPVWENVLGGVDFDDSTIAAQEHVEGGGRITYGELKREAVLLGVAIQRELGLRTGDMVMIAATNSIQWLVTMFACQFSGLTITLVNPQYLDHELGHTLELTDPKFVFFEEGNLAKFQANAWPESKLIAMDKVVAENASFRTTRQLLKPDTDVNSAKASTPASIDEVAFLCLSSGTTGLPKAVQLTHRNVAAMLHTLNSIPGAFAFKPFKSAVFLPFFHAFGLQTGALLSHKNRGTMHLCTPFTLERFVKLVEEERIEYSGLSPPLVAGLCTVPGLRPEQFSSIRFTICGGAALDAVNQTRCQDRLGIQILQGWGMSELCVANLGFGFHQTAGSVGWLMPGVRARVVDDNMKNVEIGGRGELLISSPTVMKGYYRNEEANKGTFDEPGHWLRTGDLVTVQEDGQFFIVDRIKEVIKVGNYQVPPAELEGILKTHPKVRLAAVVGVLNRTNMTEMPRAYIELVPECQNAGPELIRELDAFLSSQTSEYKHLRGGIKFVPRVPVSVTGKVIRKEVRQMCQNDPDLAQVSSA